MSTNALARIETESAPLVQEAHVFTITDDESFKVAGARMKAIKDFRAQVAALFDPQIESAHMAHKVALDQKKKFETPLIEADKLYRKKRSDYEIEIERQAEAEKRKLEAEARAKEAQIKKEMEAAAKEAEAKHDQETADSLRAVIPQVVVESEARAIAVPKSPAVEGFSSAKDYNIDVVNPMVLIQAIACGEVNINVAELITWKVSVLKAYLKSTGKEEIPGCMVEKKRVQKVF